jgi:hypothetical protein
MAESVDRDAAQEVQIFLAGRVINVRAATVRDYERLALITRHEISVRVAETRVDLRFCDLRML